MASATTSQSSIAAGTSSGSVNVSGLFEPFGIAIDGSGNAWAISFSDHVGELKNDLTVLSGASGYIDRSSPHQNPGLLCPPQILLLAAALLPTP